MGWKWAELLSRWTQIHYEHGGVIHQTPQAPERSFQNEDVLANLSYFFYLIKKSPWEVFMRFFEFNTRSSFTENLTFPNSCIERSIQKKIKLEFKNCTLILIWIGHDFRLLHNVEGLWYPMCIWYPVTMFLTHYWTCVKYLFWNYY